MKKVAGIIAVTVFTFSLFAVQITEDSISSNSETSLACNDCDFPDDDRGSN